MYVFRLLKILFFSLRSCQAYYSETDVSGSPCSLPSPPSTPPPSYSHYWSQRRRPVELSFGRHDEQLSKIGQERKKKIWWKNELVKPNPEMPAGLPGLAFSRPKKQIWPFLNWSASKCLTISSVVSLFKSIEIYIVKSKIFPFLK